MWLALIQYQKNYDKVTPKFYRKQLCGWWSRRTGDDDDDDDDDDYDGGGGCDWVHANLNYVLIGVPLNTYSHDVFTRF